MENSQLLSLVSTLLPRCYSPWTGLWGVDTGSPSSSLSSACSPTLSPGEGSPLCHRCSAHGLLSGQTEVQRWLPPHCAAGDKLHKKLHAIWVHSCFKVYKLWQTMKTRAPLTTRGHFVMDVLPLAIVITGTNAVFCYMIGNINIPINELPRVCYQSYSVLLNSKYCSTALVKL